MSLFLSFPVYLFRKSWKPTPVGCGIEINVGKVMHAAFRKPQSFFCVPLVAWLSRNRPRDLISHGTLVVSTSRGDISYLLKAIIKL